jgi:glutamyl-tRNA(Gln) amidotransferase subunit D
LKERLSLSLEESGYSGLVLEKLSKANATVGDKIKIVNLGHETVGILMPRAQIGSDPYHIVIKLDTGYNIGVYLEPSSEIYRIKGSRKRKASPSQSPELQDDLPTVAILSTGGTIASKVDYKTGAVNPALSAKDLYDAVPELRHQANVRAKIVMSILSENIRPSDWTKTAKSVAAEIKDGADGVVIAHGTDTLGFTSAALSFALQDLPIPIALVGSQRSSDRPSSDAALNLLGATDLVGRANVAEVMVVMHGEIDDTFLYAHRGTRTRKSHTSRRDAFQSINSHPIYRIDESGIAELSQPILRRDPNRKLRLKPKFEERVTLVKTFPGMSESIIDYYVNEEYRGIIIEGTGLGHAPEHIHESLQSAIESDIVVAMTSQCISGRVDMNVYRPGVKMLEMGVVPCEDMIPETALVKMMWLLANTKRIEDVREKMVQNIIGEIEMRTEQSQYRPNQETS